MSKTGLFAFVIGSTFSFVGIVLRIVLGVETRAESWTLLGFAAVLAVAALAMIVHYLRARRRSTPLDED